MSCESNLTVQFEVRDANKLQAIAEKHRERMAGLSYQNENFDRDALGFLEYVAQGNGVGVGPKGDMLTWGRIGNYVEHVGFVDALASFFTELYEAHVVFDHTGILVMHQQEQHALCTVYELSLIRDGEEKGNLRSLSLSSPFPLFGWYYERRGESLPPGMIKEILRKKDL